MAAPHLGGLARDWIAGERHWPPYPTGKTDLWAGFRFLARRGE